MRQNIKKIKKLVLENKKEQAKKLIPETYKAIDKAVKNNILKKNTGARKAGINRIITKDQPQTSPKQP